MYVWCVDVGIRKVFRQRLLADSGKFSIYTALSPSAAPVSWLVGSEFQQ